MTATIATSAILAGVFALHNFINELNHLLERFMGRHSSQYELLNARTQRIQIHKRMAFL